jgi:hypothetical protein
MRVHRLKEKTAIRCAHLQCKHNKRLREWNLPYTQDYYTWLAVVSVNEGENLYKMKRGRIRMVSKLNCRGIFKAYSYRKNP